MACFEPPFVFVTDATTTVALDLDAARTRFAPAFDSLVRHGFASTTLDGVTARALGDDLALLDARFTRRRSDGSAMEQVAGLYVARRTDAGWRIAAVVQHPHDVAALPS